MEKKESKTKLEEIYSRLIGIKETIGEQNFFWDLADDFNKNVDESSEILDKDLNYYKIPEEKSFGHNVNHKYCPRDIGLSKINQFIRFLENSTDVSEKIKAKSYDKY